MQTVSENRVLAMVLRQVADQLDDTDVKDEFISPDEMLSATLNNVAHDFGETFGNPARFFTKGG